MAGFDAHSNLSISTVVTPPSPATTGISLSIVAGHGASRFDIAPPYNVTVQQSGVLPDRTNAEVCRVTARAGDTLTLLRAQEGTTARAILPGDLIYVSITAKALQDIESGVNFPLITTPGPVTSGGVAGAFVFTTPTGILRSTSVDGTDDRHLFLTAGGAVGIDRGALIDLMGNDLAGSQGNLLLAAGAPLGQIQFGTNGALSGTMYPSGGMSWGTAPDPGAQNLSVSGTVTAVGGLGTTPLNATQATSGTLPDARLSVNVLKHTGGYPGGTGNFLRADGTFALPPGGGGVAAHHLTHEVGGSDELVGAVWTFANNVFTSSPQTFLGSTSSSLVIKEMTAPAQARGFRVNNQAQTLSMEAVDDGGTIVQTTPLRLGRTGDAAIGGSLRERGRSTPLGDWVAATKPAGWTGIYVYSLVGKTLLVNLYATHPTLAVSTPAPIIFTLPFVVGQTGSIYAYQEGGVWKTGISVTDGGNTNLQLYPFAGATFAGGNTIIAYNLAIQMA